MDFGGVFKDWKFGEYKIVSPDNDYVLWTCSGFLGFKDYGGNKANMIKSLSFCESWELWKEYKRERRRRVKNDIDSFKEGE